MSELSRSGDASVEKPPAAPQVRVNADLLTTSPQRPDTSGRHLGTVVSFGFRTDKTTRRGQSESLPTARDRVKLKVASAGAAVVLATAACTTEADTSRDTPDGASQMAEVSTCAPSGIPLTSEEVYCDDRRTGRLGVVVVPDLPSVPFINAPDRVGIEEAADYGADVLREVSDGALDFQAEVIEAAPGTGDLIRERNRGFQEGRECVDIEDKDNLMGHVVATTMPELQDKYTQIVVFGGDSCATDIAEEDIGGVARYEHGLQFADVYTDTASQRGVNWGGSTPLTEIGSTIAHEVGHNYGLGHAGYLSFANPVDTGSLMNDASQPVDIPKLIRTADGYGEYSDIGNVMSNAVVPLDFPGAENYLTTPMQEQFIATNSDPNFDYADSVVKFLIGASEETIDREEASPLKAIKMPLGVGEEMRVAGHLFSSVVYEPIFTNEGDILLNISLSTGASSALLYTAGIGSFVLPKNGTRQFSTKYHDIEVGTIAGQERVNFSIKEKLE